MTVGTSIVLLTTMGLGLLVLFIFLFGAARATDAAGRRVPSEMRPATYGYQPIASTEKRNVAGVIRDDRSPVLHYLYDHYSARSTVALDSTKDTYLMIILPNGCIGAFTVIYMPQPTNVNLVNRDPGFIGYFEFVEELYVNPSVMQGLIHWRAETMPEWDRISTGDADDIPRVLSFANKPFRDDAMRYFRRLQQ